MEKQDQPWDMASQLDGLRERSLWRQLRPLDEVNGVRVRAGTQEWINFSSNDYLGLASSQEMREALARGLALFGGGAGASRLVCGTQRVHLDFEEAMADFKGTEAALAFSSGFAAAVGTIPALLGAGDTVILDKLCHASLVDAARLSGATIRVFPHNNLEKLERLLKTAKGRVLVVTESIFSMDGDAAPLADMVALKDRHGAWLMVDEAHAVGLIGPQGRGLAAELGVNHRIELQMGTMSKAMGLSGGYLAASREVIDLLINRARSFIYSTAFPPHLAVALKAMLELVRSERGESLRGALWANVDALRTVCRRVGDVAGTAGAILPVILGSEERAVQAAARLADQGLLVPCIRYPTVARGRARLRVTASALHKPDEVAALERALCACL